MLALMPWRRPEVSPLFMFENEMDKVFRRFFGEPLGGEVGVVKTWTPLVDVEQTDKEMLVKVDLPGVEPKDVEIALTDGTLVVSGEKKVEHEEKKKNIFRTERFYGRFNRDIPLPAEAEAEKITAAEAHGVITVTIPKK